MQPNMRVMGAPDVVHEVEEQDPPMGRVVLAVTLALGALVWGLAGIGVAWLAGGLR